MRAELLLALLVAGCAVRVVSNPPPSTGREVIRPAAGRPYSQAVRVGDTYYLAGRIGVTEATSRMTAGRAAAETRNILEQFRELLSELGLSLRDVVQATVYLADIADYDEMNRVYAEYFPSDPPARETVAVAGIVAGARVEISMIAVRRER
jgi:2-iminobutanoate/2-iminopropanoate deaminase